MKSIAIFVNTLMNGGAEKQSVILYNTLYKCYDIIFIVYHKRTDPKIVNLFEDYPNSKILYLEGSEINKMLKLFWIFKKNNITHLFNYLTKPNFIGTTIGHLANVKYKYNGIRSSNLPKWKLLIEKYISNKLSTLTIANSFNGANYLKINGFRNIQVIPNCFCNIDEPISRIDLDQIRIITVGRFVHEKDYLTAIKAIKELAIKEYNISFIIVGYGELEDYIKVEINKNEIKSITQVIINPNNISELLKTANIYLSTSLYEGTSNSIMEAMNASLPIIATKVGDNDKLVNEGVNGFLHNIKDYKSIAKSIEILILNNEIRDSFGKESNSIIRKQYSNENFKNAYSKLIENK